jgi:hypothetical protein
LRPSKTSDVGPWIAFSASSSAPPLPPVNKKTVLWQDVERPNVERPNVERPNVERPNVEQLNVEYPNVERPNVERPNFYYG